MLIMYSEVPFYFPRYYVVERKVLSYGVTQGMSFPLNFGVDMISLL